MKWAVGWDGQVGLYKAGTQSSGSGSSSKKNLNFLVPAPTSRSFRFRLRLQNNVVNWKPKTIVILVKLAFAANYVCGSGTQISGCGSTVKKFLAPAPAIQNRLGSGSGLLLRFHSPVQSKQAHVLQQWFQWSTEFLVIRGNCFIVCPKPPYQIQVAYCAVAYGGRCYWI